MSHKTKKSEIEEAVEKASEAPAVEPNQRPDSTKKGKTDETKIAELTEILKRLQAEFINYTARTEKESRQIIEYSNADLIKKILPVIDSLELALKNSSDLEKFREGIKLIYSQLLEIMKQEGLRPIEALGQMLDIQKHEVLLKEKSDKVEDTVIEELQKGYMLKDKVLRHSKGKISG